LVFQENGETYYTVKEASEYLGISRQALNGYVRRNKLQKYERTLARRVFFKKSELDRMKAIRPSESKDE